MRLSLLSYRSSPRRFLIVILSNYKELSEVIDVEVKEAIKSRRSIRSYRDDEVPSEDLEAIIEAGMYAPSAGNEQPWEFVVINDRKKLDEIALMHDNAGMVEEAPVALAVCSVQDRVKHGKMWVQDCAAATQNMLLQAHSHGYATCWVGVYSRSDRERDMAELLELPEGVVPFSLIPVGRPPESIPDPDRFKPERIRQNSW